jgi:hypothetical protein
MPIVLNLKKVREALLRIALDGGTGVTGVAGDGTPHVSSTFSATPVLHASPPTGETRANAAGEQANCFPVLPQTPQTRAATQGIDIADIRKLDVPVAPATPDFVDAHRCHGPWVPRARRPAQCLHQWIQEERSATCAACGFTVPVLPQDSAFRGGEAP